MKKLLLLLLFILLLVACSGTEPIDEPADVKTTVTENTSTEESELIEDAVGPPEGGSGAPDFAVAAATLGVSEDDLRNALGTPPPDFEAAAATLGVTVEALQETLGGAAPPDGDAQAPPEGSAEESMPTDSDNGRLFAIPGDNVFPEGVSYDKATGKFYVGSTTDGTLYVGDVNGDLEMTVFSEGGADGRTTAVGTQVDSEGRLWVAGGRTGQMFVYDTVDGALIATITTPASDAAFINDLAITERGVYFTDSFRPILWRVTGIAQGEAEAWLDFTGTVINYVDGFNLNGIVSTEDGNTLIVVHTGEGKFYRIDIATQEVAQIDTGTTDLTAGDGLALIGNTIYVTRNRFGEIVPLEFSADFSTATGEIAITSDLFSYPTTIAPTGNSFLVANSQFNNRNAPNLPFTIAQIPLTRDEATGTMETTTFQIEVWADNWFAAYLGEELIVEDSVSITTERSFNAETATFEASYPLALNFILKDFKENDTGLEYIGSSRQQMGDGGFIMQLTDLSAGNIVAVSNAEWACMVIHEAPLDKSCENESNPVAGVAPCEFADLVEPDGWKAADFNDSSWIATTVHSVNDVSPKDGYNQINWNTDAEMIWGPDLETNNTILCRVMVAAP